jgi:hypothetical protein
MDRMGDPAASGGLSPEKIWCLGESNVSPINFLRLSRSAERTGKALRSDDLMMR